MLHIISNHHTLETCTPYICDNDEVLFVSDGVYTATRIKCTNVYALKDDVLARAVVLPEGVNKIDIDQFVRLVVAHSNSITWI